jgi:hypothetical protein
MATQHESACHHANDVEGDHFSGSARRGEAEQSQVKDRDVPKDDAGVVNPTRGVPQQHQAGRGPAFTRRPAASPQKSQEQMPPNSRDPEAPNPGNGQDALTSGQTKCS